MVYHRPSIITTFITAREGSTDDQVQHCKRRLNLRLTMICCKKNCLEKNNIYYLCSGKTLIELKYCLLKYNNGAIRRTGGALIVLKKT